MNIEYYSLSGITTSKVIDATKIVHLQIDKYIKFIKRKQIINKWINDKNISKKKIKLFNKAINWAQNTYIVIFDIVKTQIYWYKYNIFSKIKRLTKSRNNKISIEGNQL